MGASSQSGEWADDRAWYPAGWRDRTGEWADAPGVRVALLGGPLDGRTATLRDSAFRLWVGWRGRELIVHASRARPEQLPAGARLVGCYVMHFDPPGLRWMANDDD